VGDSSADHIHEVISKLSLYDGPTSSPLTTQDDNSPQDHNNVTTQRGPMKSRRHSSNPASFNGNAQKRETEEPKSAEPPRPTSAIGYRVVAPKSGSAGDLKRSASVTAISDVAGRAERMASRRRSMMT